MESTHDIPGLGEVLPSKYDINGSLGAILAADRTNVLAVIQRIELTEDQLVLHVQQ